MFFSTALPATSDITRPGPTRPDIVAAVEVVENKENRDRHVRWFWYKVAESCQQRGPIHGDKNDIKLVENIFKSHAKVGHRFPAVCLFVQKTFNLKPDSESCALFGSRVRVTNSRQTNCQRFSCRVFLQVEEITWNSTTRSDTRTSRACARCFRITRPTRRFTRNRDPTSEAPPPRPLYRNLNTHVKASIPSSFSHLQTAILIL